MFGMNGGTPLSASWRTASADSASIESIVHGLSSVASVTGRQPRSDLHLTAHDLHDLTGHALGEIRREPADHGRDVLGREAVELAFLRVHEVARDLLGERACARPGAIALTRTPMRSSSRAITIVIDAMPALAAA